MDLRLKRRINQRYQDTRDKYYEDDQEFIESVRE